MGYSVGSAVVLFLFIYMAYRQEQNELVWPTASNICLQDELIR